MTLTLDLLHGDFFDFSSMFIDQIDFSCLFVDQSFDRSRRSMYKCKAVGSGKAGKAMALPVFLH